MSEENKPREWWLYQGIKNCSGLLFTYREQQPIKTSAPENFEEHKVIERSFHDAETERLNQVILRSCKTIADIEADRDHYKALCEELGEYVRKVSVHRCNDICEEIAPNHFTAQYETDGRKLLKKLEGNK